MEFRCRLGTPGGDILEGVYVADSEARLRTDLEGQGLYVLSLRRRGSIPGVAGLALGGGRRRRVSRQEFLIFNQELATLLKAGIPLVQSLEILGRRVSNPTFKAVLDGIHARVKAGASLSEAFADHAGLFPSVYSASLMAGERSGSLENVIRRYVSYEKLIGAVKRRTISALIYPAILVAMMCVLVAIIIVRVIPAFSGFYVNFDRPLPLSTRVIMGISGFIVTNVWFILPIAAAVILGGLGWARRPDHRLRIDRMLLTLPIGGATIRKFSTSQLARTLATLLGGGIPLVNALEIAGNALTNRHLTVEIADVTRRVREGQSFATALAARGIFADVAIKMVEVGESTGALQDMLNSLADFYDDEIETEVARFITLIEPVILVIMGIVIAGVVLALYMPLFELGSAFGG